MIHDQAFQLANPADIGDLRLILSIEGEGTTALVVSDEDWADMGCPSIVRTPAGDLEADVIPARQPRGRVLTLKESAPEPVTRGNLFARLLQRMGII